jgi:hypothetical protein
MSRRTALWTLGIVMVVLLGVLGVIDGRLHDTGGPGIVTFEVAGSEERANEIKDDWGTSGRDDARLSLWLDYPYLLAYGAFWALAVAATRDFARRRGWSRFAAPGAVIVGFPIGAALLDALENANLLLVLDGHGGDTTPLLAAVFASGKFVLTGVTILYVLAGLVLRVARRGEAGARAP